VHQPGLALPTAREIVETLKWPLPRTLEGQDALVVRINGHHHRSRGVMGSRFGARQATMPP